MKYNYLAALRDGIPYRKDLRKCVGSVTATILMQQLDFHFASYPDGFYKFLSPVESHPDYRENDSWTEELAFSEKEFRCAFDHIGVRHNSKSSYMQAKNPFVNEKGEEVFYCSYHDKQKGLTWYFRNHGLVDLLIEKLIALSPPKERKRSSKVDSTVTYQKESTVNDDRESCNLPKVSYVTDQKESTFIYKENNKKDNKEKTPPSPSNVELSFAETGQNQSQQQDINALPAKTESPRESDRPSSSSMIPARENRSQKTADRVRAIWQETGCLPKIPLELNAWAVADIGQNVLSAYRKSGSIVCTSPNDIDPRLTAYAAKQNPGKDFDYGYAYIKKLENDPREWPTLVALITKWQASLQTGDRHLNIAQVVERSSRPPIALNLNF